MLSFSLACPCSSSLGRAWPCLIMVLRVSFPLLFPCFRKSNRAYLIGASRLSPLNVMPLKDGHPASSQLAPTREDVRQTGESPSLSSGVSSATPTTRTPSVSPGRADETRLSGSEPGSPPLPSRHQTHHRHPVASAPGTAGGVSGLRQERDNDEGVTVDGRPLGMSGGDSCRLSPEEKEALVSLKG